MPSEQELPAGISALARRNAAELRSGPEFRQRLEKLVAQIEHALGEIGARNALWAWMRSGLWRRR